jgi:hypothetical protein
VKAALKFSFYYFFLQIIEEKTICALFVDFAGQPDEHCLRREGEAA